MAEEKAKEAELLTQGEHNNNIPDKNDPPPPDTPQGSFYKYRALKTGFLLFGLVLFGMSFSLLGAAFVDLEQYFSTDARVLSLVMPISSVGLIIASMLEIFRLNKLSVELSMIIPIFMICTITTIWTTVCSVYWFLGLAALHGFFTCILFCEIQPYFLQLWANHRLQKPLLMAIFALMTLGLAIGPFVATPFLAGGGGGHHGHHGHQSDHISPLALSDNHHNVTVTALAGNSTTPATKPEYTGHVRQAFIVLGLPLLIPGILYSIVCFKAGASVLRKAPGASHHGAGHGKEMKKISKFHRNVSVLLTMIIYFFQAISEFLPLAFFTLYVSTLLGWVLPYSTLINSAFNGALCLGRVLGVPLSAWLKPRTILAINLSTMLAGAGLLLLSRVHDLFVWGGAATLGLGTSLVFGTMLLWLSEDVKVNDRLMAGLIVSNSLGGIVGPTVTGQLFVLVSPMSMPVMILLSAVVEIILYIVLRILERKRHDSKPLSQEEDGLKINNYLFVN